MDLTVIMEKGRESGDGMEQEEASVKLEKTKDALAEEKPNIKVHENTRPRKHSTSSSAANALPLPGLHSLYRRPEVVTRSLAPTIPKGQLVQLTPRLVQSTATVSEHKKAKLPKFIPYEPYTGAVNPIDSTSQTQPGVANRIKINKNNLDIGVLVDQMSVLRTQELNDGKDAEHLAVNTTKTELEKLKLDMEKMKEERDYYQAQYKFQTQVNSELKNLLVASVGEDLQTRVNVLTEDKLQLARALLHTANNLTTHTEQIEFLASQCEVWRSKFLASSVMVEELARWKADLTQKNQMLNEATKLLLHAMHQIREMQLDALKNLKFLAKIRYLNLPSTDVVSLTAENLNILQKMVLHSGVGIPEGNLNISTASTNPLCDAEKYATQALQFLSQPLMATDEAIRALFEQTHRPYGSGNANASNSTSIV